MANPISTNNEFNLWWNANRGSSEFTGVSMPAAMRIWNASHSDKAEIIEDKPDELPPAFMKHWERVSKTAEFTGVSMAAAYATWLAAVEWSSKKAAPKEVVAPEAGFEVETLRTPRGARKQKVEPVAEEA